MHRKCRDRDMWRGETTRAECFEAGPPAALYRMGVRPAAFKMGTTVTVHGYRAKNLARMYGQARDIVTADGKTYVIGGKAE